MAQPACCDLSPAPLAWALPLQQMLGGSNIACSVGNIHCRGARGCGFSKEFCVNQVVCNLPALQGEVNLVAKPPSG